MYSLFAALLCTAASYAQDEVENPADEDDILFHVSGGIVLSQSSGAGADDFRRLMPSSEIMARDLSAFTTGGDRLRLNNAFSFGTRWRPFKHDDGTRKRLHLRIGISVFGSSSHHFYSSGTDRYRVDTLVSPVTGSSLPIDSVRFREVRGRTGAEHYYLDLALQYETDWDSRWTGFAAVNLSFGLSTLRQSRAVMYTDRSAEIGNDYGFVIGREHDFEEDFEFHTNGFGGMATLPLGIAWQLSESHPFLSSLQLCAEWRPGIHVSRLEGVGTYLSPISFSVIGFRIRV